ncbi:MAG: hypothetical protein EXR11_11225 [Rhodospirillaceae bacterium]|nr:hypothetical protein [Rhodospirillaceae bacterium]
MDNIKPDAEFGWSEVIAALLAVAVTAIAAPSPAASAEDHAKPALADHDDWNFLWIAPEPATSHLNNDPRPVHNTFASASLLLRVYPQTDEPHWQTESEIAPAPQADSSNRTIEQVSTPVRFTPAATGPSINTVIAVREDRWTILNMDGVMRVAAYARGPVDIEDLALATRTPAPFPRGVGTGFSLVTDTPVYLGATVKTDRSIYDIDTDRFRGARWTTSVFMGTDTSFGPLYLGTTKNANGSRGAYLYLGRWF